MENQEKNREIQIQELKKQLTDSGIDISLWGTGTYLAVENLFEELEKGDCRLIKTGEKIMREVRSVGARVFYKNYVLVEDKQVFNDGRIRVRNNGYAVSEKLMDDEDPLDGMVRGIREELGLKGDLDLRIRCGEMKSLNSPSYPGLETQYTILEYDLVLTDDQFDPDGYIDVGDNMTTYFVWKEINGR